MDQQQQPMAATRVPAVAVIALIIYMILFFLETLYELRGQMLICYRVKKKWKFGQSRITRYKKQKPIVPFSPFLRTYWKLNLPLIIFVTIIKVFPPFKIV